MARCDYCGTTIVFGGTTDGGLRFCSEKCHAHEALLTVADQIPEGLLSQYIAEVSQGSCPKCGGEGPVEVYTSYVVWSILVMTSWSSRPEICCRACGMKSQIGAVVLSGIVGWWGFPWGFIVTPIQIVRNVAGLLASPDPTTASTRLESIIKVKLAAQLIEASQREQANT